MKTIEIVISPSGQTRLETKGFAGSGCLDGSRFLEEVLGERLAEQRSAEFYRTASEALPVSQHG